MPVGVIIGVASALFTALVTEIYCHRSLAHRAFRVRPVLASLLDTYFRVIVGTDPAAWAAVHRLHHRYADTPLDPHSPVLRRPITVLAGSAYLFARARGRLAVERRPRRGILALRALVVAFHLVLFGWVQVVVMLAVHLVCYLGIQGLVNTVGHLYGRKPYPDASGYDVAWLAVPLLGHGYHNTHHACPAAARTGALDSVWPLLRLLAAARLIELDGPRARARAPQPTAAGSRPTAPRPFGSLRIAQKSVPRRAGKEGLSPCPSAQQGQIQLATSGMSSLRSRVHERACVRLSRISWRTPAARWPSPGTRSMTSMTRW